LLAEQTATGFGEIAPDGEQPGPETGPLRRCIATSQVLAKTEMIRFVIAPDGTLTPDLEEKLPGRGLWLSSTAPAFADALKKRSFSRAARRNVDTPPDLAGRIATLLETRISQTLGLARRAGQALSGFEKVQEALKAGTVGLLVEANDAGGDARKMRALARAVTADVKIVSPLTGEALGKVFGRDRTVHIGLTSGRLASRIACDAIRLAGILAASPVEAHKNGPEGECLPAPGINDQPSEIDD
jgi:uncharacterized protein